MKVPEAVILIGIPASGKSAFYSLKFADTHLRINLDMLKTRNREKIIFEACIRAKQSMVIDNTNIRVAQRHVYMSRLKAAGFRIIGYYFVCDFEGCRDRNSKRSNSVPIVAIKTMAKGLEPPALDEGFDELYIVELNGEGFHIKRFGE